MKILGVDYGEKRVGVAVSDEEERIAFPKTVIQNSSSLALNLRDIAYGEGTLHIVLGESHDFKGAANPVMKNILKLKKALEEFDLTVSMEPEFMTSAQARHLQGENDKLDSSSAALILQGYLDRKRK